MPVALVLPASIPHNRSTGKGRDSGCCMADERDEELVRRFRAGDNEALNALFERHEALLRGRAERCLPRYLRRRVSVADVLQETRLVALQRRDAFEDRGDDAFRRWLLGIVENKARRAVQWHDAQKRDVRREVTRGQRPTTAHVVGAQTSPSEAAIGAELRAFVQDVLDDLPEDYRQILHLVRERHLNLKQAAEVMARSHEATKKLYQRALARFTAEFEKRRGESLG